MVSGSHKRLLWWHIVLVLALPLTILFHPSLRPELVLFSNDGPLGIISSEAGSLPGAFAGYWDDLNWVGQEKPSALVDFSMLLGMLVPSSVIYSKIYAPMALLFLGLAGFFLFRMLGFKPIVCLLGAIAFAFNMNAFSNACWGLPSRATTLASMLFALGIFHFKPRRWLFAKYLLAGFAVGHGIMEGFDVGALYSLAVGAYLIFLLLNDEKGETKQRAWKALACLGIVSLAAMIFSAQALSTLISTQIKGVVGMSQDANVKDARWNEATQWSLPVKELLRVAVPGLFGYRMTDTGGKFEASSYWGSVGQTAGWEIHKQGLARHSGSGEYAGMLVLCLASFAFFQSLRSASPFNQKERRTIWFWFVLALISALLALGKHGPLYKWVYALPYFSMIRNPIKFMHLFHLALIILFGYGAQLLLKHYWEKGIDRQTSIRKHLTQWWASARGFERRWTFGMGAVLVLLILCWLIYASSKKEMIQVMLEAAIPNSTIAETMHGFGAKELLWSVLFLAVNLILIIFILSGTVRQSSGRKLASIMLILLIVDLSRANRFWIVYYDYQKKYASNPIIEKLRHKPFEARITSTLNPFAPTSLAQGQQAALLQFFTASWLQHPFPYFNIHSLDVVQMPRRKRMDERFGLHFAPQNAQEAYKYTRLWELTSTRYLIGMTNSAALLNRHFDHGRDRFQILSRFQFAPKSNETPAIKVDDWTAQIHPEGAFAIIEFKGALPKVKRFSNWTIQTNEAAALRRLSDLQFDPAKEIVVMSDLTNLSKNEILSNSSNSGQASIEEYHPKLIRIKSSGSEGIVLLNDRYHPNWAVYVNDERQTTLRCNYLMRGVAVPAGEQRIEFRYEAPLAGLAISSTSMGLGIFLCVFFTIDNRKKSILHFEKKGSPMRDQKA